MAPIVAVHGAFNELWGPHELHSRWLPALRDGLWHAGAHIQDVDLRICFYGDLFRRDPEVEGLDAIEQSRAGAADLLEQVGGAEAVDSIVRFAASADRDRTLDLIATLTQRADLNSRVLERFDATISADTRVVVAHSLGTIVAYRALLAHPEWRIDTFVTLGSPLGGSMVDTMLSPARGGVREFPTNIRRWVNVRAVRDVVATDLDGHFSAPVEDRLVDNGHRAHDPIAYLNARATGVAIAEGLGHGFS